MCCCSHCLYYYIFLYCFIPFMLLFGPLYLGYFVKALDMLLIAYINSLKVLPMLFRFYIFCSISYFIGFYLIWFRPLRVNDSIFFMSLRAETNIYFTILSIIILGIFYSWFYLGKLHRYGWLISFVSLITGLYMMQFLDDGEKF